MPPCSIAILSARVRVMVRVSVSVRVMVRVSVRVRVMVRFLRRGGRPPAHAPSG